MTKYSKEVLRLVDYAVVRYSYYDELTLDCNIDYNSSVPFSMLSEIAQEIVKDNPEILDHILSKLFSERLERYNQDCGFVIDRNTEHPFPRDNGKEFCPW